MRLIELGQGGVSLEFASWERDPVMARLRGLGDVSIERKVTFDRIRVDDAELMYTDDWDEPCLIAFDPKGSAILRLLSRPSDSHDLGDLIPKASAARLTRR